MILYKYTDFETAKLIAEGATVKFTRTNELNDPFETSCQYFSELSKHPDIFKEFSRYFSLERNYGILALSRSPLNPLLWAHYGDKHTGATIGIDISKTDFNDDGKYIIPARLGNVIYTKTKPIHHYHNSEDEMLFSGQLQNFNPHALEALQRTFLYKSAEWSYEEEVRVVKWLGNKISPIQAINRESITEISFGCRRTTFNEAWEAVEYFNEKLPNCTLHQCLKNKESWELKREVITLESLQRAKDGY